MRYSSALINTLGVLPVANCVAFGGPAPTPAKIGAVDLFDGFSPKPTKAPAGIELRKRQAADDSQICGFVDGFIDSSIYCYTGTCMLYTTSGFGMAGCCSGGDTQNCNWASSCVDYDTYWSSTDCGASCESNSYIRKCTASAYPYCVTWRYASDPDVWDYGCTDDIFDTDQTLYAEATDGASVTSISLTTLTGDAVIFDSTTEDTSDFYDVTTETTETTDTADAITEITSDDTDPTSLPDGDLGSTKKKKSSSVGIIVGAVVGGIVLIALIAGVTIFLCVRKRRQALAAANPPPTQPGLPQQPQPQQPVSQVPQFPATFQPQSPPPQQYAGYFAQPTDQKINPQTQVHEYSVHSPTSNPATPAPPYVQPYYANTPVQPPVPAQSPAAYQTPAPETHEVDSIAVAPQPAVQQPAGNVYEIGGGK
ncbi:hypothetical protein CC78DRAFT_304401 [Lojkania enalia]|uniref:Mid2 domain-containing protein n=1 Tax=Lojkania enalia TaxID=147567 RepID=A0A9P4N9L0_9PLEO|nr:hypothetical protein CC78DRAFT_304401 [Didymosphaeria enalia]